MGHSIKEMAQDIGKKGTIKIGGLTIEVEVQDVKMSYGQKRWLVAPLAGAGEVWVEAVTLTD